MLRAVLIDDERPSLDELTFLLKNNSVEVIGVFQSTEGVLDFIVGEKPDIVFVDINLQDENGIDFGVEVQKRVTNIAVIFVTAYAEYALSAFRAYPMDYIMKPVDESRLVHTLGHIRETMIRPPKCAKLEIRCFGNLEIIFGNDRIKLPTKKTYELLAYLLCNEREKIHREDLIRLMFSEKSYDQNKNNLRVSLSRLRKTFSDLSIGQEIFSIKEDNTVKIKSGICDIVDFKRFTHDNHKIDAKNIEQAEKVADLVNGKLLVNIDAFWVTEERECIIVCTEELFINMSMFYMSKDLYDKAENVLLRLLSINPLSEQVYRLLLDLYIRTENNMKYRNYYDKYKQMAEMEYRDSPLKVYADYYTRCLNDIIPKKSRNQPKNK